METVLITGASRGIGLELTNKFLELNYKVIATYRNKPSTELEKLQSNENISLIELEVTDEISINKLKDYLQGIKIDILINNAGIIGPEDQSVEGITRQDWLTTFAINSIAPLMISRAVLNNMESAINPRIITISSQMGAINRDNVGMYAYRSSKVAVNKVMKVLALELKEKSIAVCLIHPGWVKTDMGGENADISATKSASGIVNIAQELTMESSGKFFNWEGNEHVW
ncbi:SDR family oxidoreductase [Psychromonas sp. KJ10-10]|uniref:SDR family oxidoreductase n=1 Tax=Psychromonas sp. KJ10-10 TaxID=3391823 RepID=UPI0039B569D9